MGTVGRRAEHRATDRWVDPVMSVLVVALLVAIAVGILRGLWGPVAVAIVVVVAVGPVLFVEFDDTSCSVGRFTRRRRRGLLDDLRVDVWPGKHGGTSFARVRTTSGVRLVFVRAFGGPGFVERAARARGVPVREVDARERPEIPVVAFALTAAIGGSLVLVAAANTLLS